MHRLIRALRSRSRDDTGSVLVLVLVIVIGVMLFMTAVLSFADSGLKTSVGYRTHRNVTYYSDGAMDGAINALRGSPSEGSVGQPCPQFQPPANADATWTFASQNQGAPGHTYTVTCQPMAGSGNIPSNQPQYAILTLGANAGEGFQVSGNHTLQVDGSVYSNGDMTYDTSNNTGTLVNGDLTTVGSCPTIKGAQILSVRGKQTCNAGPTAKLTSALTNGTSYTTLSVTSLPTAVATGDTIVIRPTVLTGGTTTQTVTASGAAAAGATSIPVTSFKANNSYAVGTLILDPGDPNYSPEVDLTQPTSTQLAAVDPKVTCGSGSPALVVFSPGLYTEVPTAPSGCSSPSNNVWWFTPGIYYLDFQAPSGGNWTPPSNVEVVGGTLANGWSAATPASTVAPAVGNPNACVEPNTTPSFPGVQVIMGGASTITLTPTNAMELCSDTSTTAQEIALYALKSGSRTEVPNLVLTPSNASSSTFLPNDSLPGVAALTPGGAATLTASGYGTIDSGSLVKSVQVQITHGESSSNVALTGTISLGGTTFNLPTSNGASTTKLANCSPTGCTQTIDVTSDLPADFPYRALDGSGSPVSVTYKATLPNNKPAATDTLTSINLLIDYVKPGFEATCAASSCSLLSNNPQGSSQNMFFHGTVYAPTSALAITVQNGGTTIFDRGVIVETLSVDVSASSKQTTSPFSLPQATTSRSVLFTETVDGSATPVLRAVATYQDYAPDPTANSGKIAIPGYVVTVSNWSVLRS